MATVCAVCYYCGCVCCVLLCSIPYECVLHMGVCSVLMYECVSCECELGSYKKPLFLEINSGLMPKVVRVCIVHPRYLGCSPMQ